MIVGICGFFALCFMGVPESAFICLEKHIIDILQSEYYTLVTLSENVDCENVTGDFFIG